MAARYGLGALVEERTERLPLSLTLATLKAADALLVLGSNDPAYTASKLYPYLLARRPLLAAMHEQSSVVEVLQRCGGGQLVTFGSPTSTADLPERISACWLQQDAHRRTMHLDQQAFAPHTAPAQACQLVHFIRHCQLPQASPL